MFLSNICETGTADVKCSACKCNIGRRLPFRPEGKNFVAFGNEKVYVFGNRLHNFIYMFGSQIATSTSSHSAPSPPAVLDNLPKPSQACVNDILVACENTSTTAEGYLKMGIGDTCRVLYVGSHITQDDAWYFAESIHSKSRGWIAKTAVLNNLPVQPVSTSVLPDSSILPQTILLSQNDIARLAATTDKSLHNLARSTINSIDSLQPQDATPHNLDNYFTWEKYIAQHKHACDIIGDGITAATCERVVNELDHNRNYRERVDLIFYRKDGTYCRLHPGKNTTRDAMPRIGVVQPDSISGFKADTNERVLYS
jgi:hypothetical protein